MSAHPVTSKAALSAGVVRLALALVLVVLEAFLRGRHPERGLLSSRDFIGDPSVDEGRILRALLRPAHERGVPGYLLARPADALCIFDRFLRH